ncbi:MAG: hypothetical protein KGI98_16410 [Euryarchaeota archaeon]|nr:hypothetical protein [Euryarchaeota archaeon]
MAVGLVLAALYTIYYLDTGLCECSGPPATDMYPSLESSARCGAYSHTYNVSVAPSQSITTSGIGLAVSNASFHRLPVAAGVSFSGRGCDAIRGGWYGVLWGPQGTPQAVFANGTGGPGWTAVQPSSLPISLTAQTVLEIVSASNYANDTLEFYGMGGASVTGQVTL